MNFKLTFLYVAISFLFIHSSSSAQIDSTALTDTSNFIPLFVVDPASDADAEGQSQNINGLLQASRDVYTQQVGFNLSFARFRLRGYNSDLTDIFIGNIPANDPENGRAIWAYWGGLNDAVRYPEVKTGIQNSQYAFGGVGGYSNISLRASDKRKGSRASLAATNRTYRSRLMFTHNTGWLKNDWAFSSTISTRYSKEGYVEGTFYRGFSYFLAAEKRLNKDHTINFALFGAPTVQGRQSGAVQEAYDLLGDNYYNPYWGFQQGEKRNARVRNNHVPYLTITSYLDLNEKSKLNSTVYFTTGRTANSNLNWYNAADPRPDYYRNLPSNNYNRGEIDQGDALTAQWQANDPAVTQLDWDAMYFANSKNLSTVENANGTGESITGNQSKYIVEDYRVDPTRLGVYNVYNNAINDRLDLTLGLNAYAYKSENYRLVKDLLGGDFWLDVDQFAERDFSDPNVAQNDLSTPNKVVKVGDRFNYDYDIHQRYAQAFGNLDYKISRNLNGYLGLSGSFTSFWRVGNLQNGKFPESSIGESEKNNFGNAGAKLGFLYKITGRHMIQVNSMAATKAPYSRNAFISPRVRDEVIGGLESSEILSADINYIVRYPRLKARLTGYYTQVNKQTWARSFYHEEFRNFVNFMMTGVDQTYKGIELGLAGDVTSTIQIQGALSLGQFLYTSRPNATITVDNSQEVLAENKTIYLKNYRIGGIPQKAGTIGIKYNSPKYWFVGVNANYAADIYLDPNPDRRTEEALVGYVSTDPQVQEILAQERLEDGFSLNAFFGFSYRIKSGKYLRFNANINNVLNNREFVSGGFEQLRYDVTNINRFPPKYFYAYGLNYFAMITYQF